jgi:hypothetical protein
MAVDNANPDEATSKGWRHLGAQRARGLMRCSVPGGLPGPVQQPQVAPGTRSHIAGAANFDKSGTMDGADVLRLVRLRCRVVDAKRRGLIVARDVDANGRVHFVVLQPVSGGRPLKYAVDPYTGKMLEPPFIEP